MHHHEVQVISPSACRKVTQTVEADTRILCIATNTVYKQ